MATVPIPSSVVSTQTVVPPAAPYNELYWIFSEIVICFVTVFSIYLLVCLARYATITHCKPGRELSGKKGKVLYRMCLVSVVMAVCRFVVDQAVAVTGWQRDQSCVISVAVSTVFYSLSLYPVYIFLWLRQSIFYANPVLSHVLNPVVTFISWATLFVMLSGGAVLTVIYVIPEVTGWEYRASPSGCRDIATASGFDLMPTLVVVFVVSFQLSLLALFIYPLLTKKTQRYRSADESGAASPTEMNDVASENDQVFRDGEQNGGQSKMTNGKKFNYEPSKSKKRFFKAPCVFYKNKDVGISTIRVENDKKKKSRFGSVAEGIRRKSSSSSSSDARKNKRSKTQQGRRVIRFIRKAFILTLICVLSDIVFTVVQMMILVPELVYLAIFDVNLLINIICIIMSFRDWPNMIMPICAIKLAKRKASHFASVSGNGGRASNTTRLILTMAQSRRETQQQNRTQANLSSSSPAEDESSGAGKQQFAEVQT
uniref:Uncharacterized protein LOC100178440 n=1 Tax=Phallusia mammillata TaxID=59560 RepID=A0A6F9DG99_9ASCI|nr:uncharacterized protein LOC100178440 [Phallusia mammillata]